MIEKFYVYRELGDVSKWGALILGDTLPDRLPNLAFGMKVFAVNEKEAITKAKEIYDKVHAYDSDKENIRRFASSALKSYTNRYNMDMREVDIENTAKAVMKIAIKMNEEYNKYFEELEKENG